MGEGSCFVLVLILFPLLFSSRLLACLLGANPVSQANAAIEAKNKCLGDCRHQLDHMENDLKEISAERWKAVSSAESMQLENGKLKEKMAQLQKVSRELFKTLVEERERSHGRLAFVLFSSLFFCCPCWLGLPHLSFPFLSFPAGLGQPESSDRQSRDKALGNGRGSAAAQRQARSGLRRQHSRAFIPSANTASQASPAAPAAPAGAE